MFSTGREGVLAGCWDAAEDRSFKPGPSARDCSGWGDAPPRSSSCLCPTADESLVLFQETWGQPNWWKFIPISMCSCPGWKGEHDQRSRHCLPCPTSLHPCRDLRIILPPPHWKMRAIRLRLNWVNLYEIVSGFKHEGGPRLGYVERKPWKIERDYLNSRDWSEEGGKSVWKSGVICSENIKFNISIDSAY